MLEQEKSFLIIYLTKSELIKRLFKCRREIFEKLSNCGASWGQSSEEINILWPFGEGSTTLNQVCCEYHCSRGNGWKGKCGKETKRNLYIFQPIDPKHFDNRNWTAWQKEKSCKFWTCQLFRSPPQRFTENSKHWHSWFVSFACLFDICRWCLLFDYLFLFFCFIFSHIWVLI